MHVHYFADHTFIMVLDSWVHTTPAEQINYITYYFENSTNIQMYKNKLIVIHEGMYASAMNSSEITKEMRKQWEALFLKYNVTIVFENHVHSYKQTYPLRFDSIVSTYKNGNEVVGSTYDYFYEKNVYSGSYSESDNGIIYIGDGSWGVTVYNDTELAWGNPKYRQLDLVSHVYHVNCYTQSGSAVIEMLAYGYDQNSKTVSKIVGSGLTVKTN